MFRAPFETFGAGLLFLAAWFALRSVSRDAGRFSLVAGLGSLYLGVDELLGLHERAGQALYEDFGWPSPPLANHWDDVFVLAIGLAGLAAVAWFRGAVFQFRAFTAAFFAGLVAFGAAILVDSAADPTKSLSWWTEETLEMAGAAAMVVAFVVRSRLLGRGASPPR